MFIDYLTVKCREAGHTDEAFIEAARFGAKCLNDRIVADYPSEDREYDLFRKESYYNSIWRNVDERPKDGSKIVLRNSATIFYALYQHMMYYAEGFSGNLKDFVGQWCYKDDMFGVPKTEFYYGGM